MNREDRAIGALFGLACGDALGRPLEGISGAEVARSYGRVTEMRSGGSRGGAAGTTTGETATALSVARSLRDGGGVDPTGRSVAGAADDAPGPSVLVRAVPPAVAYADPDRTAAAVEAAARPSPPDRTAVESAVALGRVVGGLLAETDAGTALDDALALAVRRDAPAGVRTALATATDGTAVSVEGQGTVGRLEAALHDALTADGPETAVVTAVNRGGRATAAGAVTGAVAGARFGAETLPDRWLGHLDGADELRDVALALVRGGFE